MGCWNTKSRKSLLKSVLGQKATKSSTHLQKRDRTNEQRRHCAQHVDSALDGTTLSGRRGARAGGRGRARGGDRASGARRLGGGGGGGSGAGGGAGTLLGGEGDDRARGSGGRGAGGSGGHGGDAGDSGHRCGGGDLDLAVRVLRDGCERRGGLRSRRDASTGSGADLDLAWRGAGVSNHLVKRTDQGLFNVPSEIWETSHRGMPVVAVLTWGWPSPRALTMVVVMIWVPTTCPSPASEAEASPQGRMMISTGEHCAAQLRSYRL